jgi:hypothetical protein
MDKLPTALLPTAMLFQLRRDLLVRVVHPTTDFPAEDWSSTSDFSDSTKPIVAEISDIPDSQIPNVEMYNLQPSGAASVYYQRSNRTVASVNTSSLLQTTYVIPHSNLIHSSTFFDLFTLPAWLGVRVGIAFWSHQLLLNHSSFSGHFIDHVKSYQTFNIFMDSMINYIPKALQKWYEEMCIKLKKRLSMYVWKQLSPTK